MTFIGESGLKIRYVFSCVDAGSFITRLLNKFMSRNRCKEMDLTPTKRRVMFISVIGLLVGNMGKDGINLDPMKAVWKESGIMAKF